MKSIRQIAQEIGVSKTAISKEITALGLRSTLHLNGNQFLVGEEEEAQIKEAFAQRSRSGEGPRRPQPEDYTQQTKEQQTTAKVQDTPFSEIVGVLETTIEALQKQLEVKDRQIEQQSRTINRLTDSVAAAQTLHAESIKAQLIAGGQDEANGGSEKKKGWWARHFGRKGA